MRKSRQPLIFFIIPYIIFFIIFSTLIILYDKGELHLKLTAFHTPFLDLFFRFVTELGGSGPVIIGVLFVLYKLSASFYILATQLVNLLITTSLKLYFGIPRPTSFFADNYPDVVLYHVEGVTMRLANGFPSGHTSAAFAMMLCIALIVKNKAIAFLCCLAAILIGYSRIYLSQHFAEDVLFGSVIGVFSALALYPFYNKLIRNNTKLNESIIQVVRR